MAVTMEDIARLRRELQDELETLSKFEALLKKRGLSDRSVPRLPAPTPIQIDDPENTQLSIDGVNPNQKGTLKRLVIQAIRSSAAALRPRDVVIAVKAEGYNFNSEASAAASVSTALQRLLESGLIEKSEGGYYSWKNAGGTHSERSADKLPTPPMRATNTH